MGIKEVLSNFDFKELKGLSAVELAELKDLSKAFFNTIREITSSDEKDVIDNIKVLSYEIIEGKDLINEGGKSFNDQFQNFNGWTSFDNFDLTCLFVNTLDGKEIGIRGENAVIEKQTDNSLTVLYEGETYNFYFATNKVPEKEVKIRFELSFEWTPYLEYQNKVFRENLELNDE